MTSPGATELRIFVFDEIARRGTPPTLAEVGAHFGCSAEDARASISALPPGAAILCDSASGEITQAGPFSAKPTTYIVQAKNKTWYANSALDVLGISVILDIEPSVEARCADCGDAIKFTIDPLMQPAFAFPDRSGNENTFIHFLVPARKWFDDITLAPRTIAFFKSDDHLSRWLSARGQAKGTVMPLDNAMRMARAWYDDPREATWRPRNEFDAHKALETAGLRGAFWRLTGGTVGFAATAMPLSRPGAEAR